MNGVREKARVGGARRSAYSMSGTGDRARHRFSRAGPVVASYSLLAAIGKLSAAELKLNVAVYNPATHYNQVRDAWHGVRTPDGR
jgi:outer membrane protein